MTDGAIALLIIGVSIVVVAVIGCIAGHPATATFLDGE